MNKSESKYFHTALRMNEALISLLEKKDLEFITVKEICETVFDITQSVVNDSAGVIISDTSIDIATVITDIEAKLDAMSVGGLLGLALLVGMVLFVVNEANRVENQVIMQMVFIDVSCQNKLILAA